MTLDSAQSGRNREAPAAVAGNTESCARKQAARRGPPIKEGAPGRLSWGGPARGPGFETGLCRFTGHVW